MAETSSRASPSLDPKSTLSRITKPTLHKSHTSAVELENNTNSLPYIREFRAPENLSQILLFEAISTLQDIRSTKEANEKENPSSGVYNFDGSKNKNVGEQSIRELLINKHMVFRDSKDHASLSPTLHKNPSEPLSPLKHRIPNSKDLIKKPSLPKPNRTLHQLNSMTTSPTAKASILQKLNAQEIGDFGTNKGHSSVNTSSSPFYHFGSGTQSPNGGNKKQPIELSYLNYQSTFNDLNSSPMARHTPSNRESPVTGQKNPTEPRRHLTLPALGASMLQEEDDEEGVGPQQVALVKKSPKDPFSQLVMYRDGKMPFHLAIGAETRQTIFQEVRRKPNERLTMTSLMDLKEKKLVDAKAKLLDRINDGNLKKKEETLQSRSQEKNALYQFHALDKKTKEKVRRKLEEQLGVKSRFLD